MSLKKSVLIIGGTGNLGRSLVNVFASSWRVGNIDLRENPKAHMNYLLDYNHKLPLGIEEVYSAVEGFSTNLDAVLCVTGYYGMASAAPLKIFEHYDKMRRANLVPSFLGGHLAARYLNPNGLLMFTGAGEVLEAPKPQTLAFSATKSALHSMARSASHDYDAFPRTATVFALCPERLDTPEMREFYPDADRSTWANTDKVAELIKEWCEGKNRPQRGSFMYLKAQNGIPIVEPKEPVFLGHL